MSENSKKKDENLSKKEKPKVLVLFGTRPEAIKCAPVIKELTDRGSFDTIVVSSSQHKELILPRSLCRDGASWDWRVDEARAQL